MIFILHSQVDQSTIDSSLGLPEYSYYFVQKEFRLALEQLGKVEIVSEPASEVAAICTRYAEQEEQCVFISFSPPNKAPAGMPCSSLCVFAWEFDTIPDEVWDGDARNDWREVFREHGRTITLSEDSAKAVRRAMGEAFPVEAIPVPVWDRFAEVHKTINRQAVIEPVSIEVTGNIVDSNLYTVTPETLSIAEPHRCFSIPVWDEQPLDMDFRLGGAQAGYLVGFYEPEPWGTWSKVEEPWVLLPYEINGAIILSLTTAAFGANAHRTIWLKLADQVVPITLAEGLTDFEVQLQLHRPAGRLRFLGLDLTPAGHATDPRTMGIGLKCLRIERTDPAKIEDEANPTLARTRPVAAIDGDINLDFQGSQPEDCHLMGFSYIESWGVWSKSDKPWIFLPREITGELKLQLCARGYGANIGRDIQVVLGDQSRSIKLSENPEKFELQFSVDVPVEAVRFLGLDLTPPEDAIDPRTMGIGVTSLQIAGGRGISTAVLSGEDRPEYLMTQLSGVVYTSVFNPGDDRKNWIDMLTAFVFAFRDVPDATLLLKMTHHSLASFLGTFHYYLQRLAPFKCRVVIVHGFLEEKMYEKLIAATSYYVNTSRCEGLCLPLMEFMACGKPGIAPLHTAMRDYVDEDANFIVNSSREPGIWPHDPRDVFRARRYRLDWWSLVECYQRSYAVAKEDTGKYRAMSDRGIERIRGFCSQQRVVKQLAEFLQVPPAG